MPSLIAATLEKVDNLIDRIHAVRRGSLVSEDTGEALTTLASHFQDHRRTLEDCLKTGASGPVVANHCDLVQKDLFAYLKYVGFLHRARHSSNPFEVHGPLKRLAQTTIDGGIRLIISSEWEFSPFTYPKMGVFGDFILLGLPASEAENVFLLPIAGHEFGHPVWTRGGFDKKFRAELRVSIVNQMRARWKEVKGELPFLVDESELLKDSRAISWWEPALENGQSQCEEMFCDLLGLWLFGDSYCQAFSHLLAPGICLSEQPWYPTVRGRAELLKRGAVKFGVSIPAGFVDDFPAVSSPTDLLSEIMTDAVAEQIDELISAVEVYTTSKGLARPTAAGRAAAIAVLSLAAPVSSDVTLPELLGAAWELRYRGDLWLSKPYLLEIKLRLLNELVLKSAEIMEYWFRVAAVS